MLRYSVTLVILMLSLLGNAHPLHLSITNIENKNDSLLISIRLFFDNHENSLNKHFIFTDVQSDTSTAATHRALDYLSAHFELIADEQNCQLRFTHQLNDDLSVWYFFSYAFPKNWNQVVLKNTLLTDIYKDQKNLVIVNRNNKELGFEFDANTTQLLILQKTAESHDE
jgi:hypothetical protein